MLAMHSRIRDVRKAKGLTLAEVAARCDPPTTAQTIGRLETGMRTVSMAWLRRIAAAMDVPTAELVTLPDRPDLPVVAILGAEGPTALGQPRTLTPPVARPGWMALEVAVGVGDYRAGDVLWLEQLPPDQFASARNRDVLAPRPVGRFVFGRLVDTAEDRLALLPPEVGARQVVLADTPWIGVVRTLIRRF
jgi:transcriptional regulator with XRE-family HTH domain